MTATLEQLEKATGIFCEVMGVESSEVSDATAYASFGPWDSLKHMEMVARFEEEFHKEESKKKFKEGTWEVRTYLFRKRLLSTTFELTRPS